MRKFKRGVDMAVAESLMHSIQTNEAAMFWCTNRKNNLKNFVCLIHLISPESDLGKDDEKTQLLGMIVNTKKQTYSFLFAKLNSNFNYNFNLSWDGYILI